MEDCPVLDKLFVCADGTPLTREIFLQMQNELFQKNNFKVPNCNQSINSSSDSSSSNCFLDTPYNFQNSNSNNANSESSSSQISDPSPVFYETQKNSECNASSSHMNDSSMSQNVNSSDGKTSSSSKFSKKNNTHNFTRSNLQSHRNNKKFISLDIAGPFEDNTYILIIIERLSGHITSLPIKWISCENIIKKLQKYIVNNGNISIIQSDLRMLFTSPAFHQFLRFNKIKLINFRYCHHSIYQIFQYINFYITNSIITLQADGHCFLNAIHYLNLTYNSASLSSTSWSPNFLFYNCTPHNRRIPDLDVIYHNILLHLQQIFVQFKNNLLLASFIKCNSDRSNSNKSKPTNSNENISSIAQPNTLEESKIHLPQVDISLSNLHELPIPSPSDVSFDCLQQKMPCVSTPVHISKHNNCSAKSTSNSFDSGFFSPSQVDNSISVSRLSDIGCASPHLKCSVPIHQYLVSDNSTACATVIQNYSDPHVISEGPTW